MNPPIHTYVTRYERNDLKQMSVKISDDLTIYWTGVIDTNAESPCIHPSVYSDKTLKLW